MAPPTPMIASRLVRFIPSPAGLAMLVSLAAAAGHASEIPTTLDAPAILQARCLRCHGGASTKGGLSLATLETMKAGGESGPAVEPGKPEESLLIEKVSGEKPEMPRGEKPLSPEEVASLRRWIAQGASWPDGLVLKEPKADAGPWWAIQPLARPDLPRVVHTDRVRTPIDAFILAALESNGLEFRPGADRRTLIRRLTYDLHGLPPTPDEMDAFERDPAPDAYERLVDRLLASPRYGERWGRHWLDVVHYGDTHGYDKDKRRPHAWRYRDYVIRALNADKPYSRFVQEQIAGDTLFPDDPDAIMATGFVAAGPWDFVGHVELREGTVDKLKTRLIDRDDMLSSTMSTFVSLTVHCARCHDHKFDPITQKDYYRLQAVFAGVDRGDRPTLDGGQVFALVSHEPREIAVLNRGDVEQPGESVGPGALACVPGLAAEFPDSAAEGPRRAALAKWITDSNNPLTWRSIVNRVWHYHFGRGIVDTPNDFGRNGSTPTHPELLDWLAVEFRDQGQSLKALHRLIVTSAAYRQSSAFNEDAAKIDADNRLYWRQNRRRLEAEAIRDATLFVAGRLDQRMGGPGFDLFRFQDDHSPVYDHDDPAWIDPPDGRRRTVYRFIVRSVPNPFVECLDGADPNAMVPVRNTTITALQALALLNDPFMIAQAEAFASRLAAISAEPIEQLDAAYRAALGRLPNANEREALTRYTARFGLAKTCRLIFNLNEFIFVE
jgi:cytochrome c553